MSDRLVCERNTNVDFIDHFRDDFYQIKSSELVRSIKWHSFGSVFQESHTSREVASGANGQCKNYICIGWRETFFPTDSEND